MPNPKRLRAVMWRRRVDWFGRIEPDGPERTGATRAACAGRLRRAAAPATLTIEVLPELVGVSEAAEVLGWDRRRVFTYISRGSFPEPVAMLASGRVWRRADIESYARRRRAPRT
jgi:predicted DNA-binding transcriptional regulator AlpA